MSRDKGNKVKINERFGLIMTTLEKGSLVEISGWFIVNYLGHTDFEHANDYMCIIIEHINGVYTLFSQETSKYFHASHSLYEYGFQYDYIRKNLK